MEIETNSNRVLNMEYCLNLESFGSDSLAVVAVELLASLVPILFVGLVLVVLIVAILVASNHPN